MLWGYINAYTAKEYTCYYLTILPECLNEGLDILFDVVFNSTLNDQSVELEKSIINEEIKMYEDSPDEKIHDLFNQQLFKNSFLGNPILGTSDTISMFSSHSLNEYYKNYFYKENIKIVVAGNIKEPSQLTDTLSNELSKYQFNLDSKPVISIDDMLFQRIVYHEEKLLEQNHICIGFPGFEYQNSDRYVLTLISTLMGGSMSSRLFQSIREKRIGLLCL